MNFENQNCREEGPKYRYWTMGRVQGRQIARGQVWTRPRDASRDGFLRKERFDLENIFY